MRTTICLWISVLLLFLGSNIYADTTTEKRRAQLANVKRVVVVPPFFGTERGQLKQEPVDKKKKPSQSEENKKNTPKPELYWDYLRKIEVRTRKTLPERLTERTSFLLISQEELDKSFKTLELTAETLFPNNGRMKNNKFVLPDKEAIRKLTENLKADAILLQVMDEPRKNNGGLSFDPLLGLGYNSPHHSLKSQFWLLLPDSTEVLQKLVEVGHPVTKLGSREFLLVDWLETADLVIENFLDELTRYTK